MRPVSGLVFLLIGSLLGELSATHELPPGERNAIYGMRTCSQYYVNTCILQYLDT